jgi:hypothetical protein
MKPSGKINRNRLKILIDNDIDYSNIFETDLEFWNKAEILGHIKK